MFAACMLHPDGWVASSVLDNTHTPVRVFEHSTGAVLLPPRPGFGRFLFIDAEGDSHRILMTLDAGDGITEVLANMLRFTAPQDRLLAAHRAILLEFLDLPVHGTWSKNRGPSPLDGDLAWSLSSLTMFASSAMIHPIREHLDFILDQVSDVYACTHIDEDGIDGPCLDWSNQGVMTWDIPASMHARLQLRDQISEKS